MNIYNALPADNFRSARNTIDVFVKLRANGQPQVNSMIAARGQLVKLAGLSALDAGVHVLTGAAKLGVALGYVVAYPLKKASPRFAFIDAAAHLINTVKSIVVLASALIGIIVPNVTTKVLLKLNLVEHEPHRTTCQLLFARALTALKYHPMIFGATVSLVGIAKLMHTHFTTVPKRIIVPDVVSVYSPVPLLAGASVGALVLGAAVCAIARKATGTMQTKKAFKKPVTSPGEKTLNVNGQTFRVGDWIQFENNSFSRSRTAQRIVQITSIPQGSASFGIGEDEGDLVLLSDINAETVVKVPNFKKNHMASFNVIGKGNKVELKSGKIVKYVLGEYVTLREKKATRNATTYNNIQYDWSLIDLPTATVSEEAVRQ